MQPALRSRGNMIHYADLLQSRESHTQQTRTIMRNGRVFGAPVISMRTRHMLAAMRMSPPKNDAARSAGQPHICTCHLSPQTCCPHTISSG